MTLKYFTLSMVLLIRTKLDKQIFLYVSLIFSKNCSLKGKCLLSKTQGFVCCLTRVFFFFFFFYTRNSLSRVNEKKIYWEKET